MKRRINKLVSVLRDQNLSLALAESMTCGLAAHQLSNISGTSDLLKGSIVCYSADVKRFLFGISGKKMEKFSCESKEITVELVRKLPKLIRADIYVAVTGLASAGGSETREKPVGTVFISVRIARRVYSERKFFRGSPLQIRKKACEALYGMIIKLVGK